MRVVRVVRVVLVRAASRSGVVRCRDRCAAGLIDDLTARATAQLIPFSCVRIGRCDLRRVRGDLRPRRRRRRDPFDERVLARTGRAGVYPRTASVVLASL